MSPCRFVRLTSYIKHSIQCFPAISNTSNFVINTTRSCVSSTSRRLKCNETLFLVFDILLPKRFYLFRAFSVNVTKKILDQHSVFFVKHSSGIEFISRTKSLRKMGHSNKSLINSGLQ